MTTFLVVAKAPVPGRVKTRLSRDLLVAAPGSSESDVQAAVADLAAASLLDTLAACASAAGRHDRCRLALDGDLADAARSAELTRALDGWTVVPQTAGDLGQRLASAHAEVDGRVVQVGMDTPQADAALLRSLADGLDSHAAVLAPAADGGWWALALRDPSVALCLGQVRMSTPRVFDDTLSALTARGVGVLTAPELTDVDHLPDLDQVARLVPGSRFAAAAAKVLAGAGPGRLARAGGIR